MKKNIIFILLAAVILLVGTFWFFRSEKIGETGEKITKKITINGQAFSTEIADTPEKRTRGLSGRSDLCAECAMLFIFEKPGAVSFWMKDMRFSLDIIWIAGDEIKGISKNVSHERGSAEVVRPSVPIDKVLEVNAGVSDKLNLKVGDKMTF